jgi:hypothetical protein
VKSQVKRYDEVMEPYTPQGDHPGSHRRAAFPRGLTSLHAIAEAMSPRQKFVAAASPKLAWQILRALHLLQQAMAVTTLACGCPQG